MGTTSFDLITPRKAPLIMTHPLAATHCDFCTQPLEGYYFLYPTGMEYDAIPHPQPIVKIWCGQCTPTTPLDPGAATILKRQLSKHDARMIHNDLSGPPPESLKLTEMIWGFFKG